MKFTRRICVAIGFPLLLYFALGVSGFKFFGEFMFTELGIIFFIIMVFIEITFLTM